MAAVSRPRTLWQNPDFAKLWAGETISVFGSQVTLALPLTAVLTLQATHRLTRLPGPRRWLYRPRRPTLRAECASGAPLRYNWGRQARKEPVHV